MGLRYGQPAPDFSLPSSLGRAVTLAEFYRSALIADRDGLLRWGRAGDRRMAREGTEILRVLGLVAGLRQKT